MPRRIRPLSSLEIAVSWMMRLKQCTKILGPGVTLACQKCEQNCLSSESLLTYFQMIWRFNTEVGLTAPEILSFIMAISSLNRASDIEIDGVAIHAGCLVGCLLLRAVRQLFGRDICCRQKFWLLMYKLNSEVFIVKLLVHHKPGPRSVNNFFIVTTSQLRDLLSVWSRNVVLNTNFRKDLHRDFTKYESMASNFNCGRLYLRGTLESVWNPDMYNCSTWIKTEFNLLLWPYPRGYQCDKRRLSIARTELYL